MSEVQKEQPKPSSQQHNQHTTVVESEFRGMSLKFCLLLFLFSIHKMFLQYTFLFCVLCCSCCRRQQNFIHSLVSTRLRLHSSHSVSIGSRESSQYEQFRKTKSSISRTFYEIPGTIFMNGTPRNALALVFINGIWTWGCGRTRLFSLLAADPK